MDPVVLIASENNLSLLEPPKYVANLSVERSGDILDMNRSMLPSLVRSWAVRCVARLVDSVVPAIMTSPEGWTATLGWMSQLFPPI